MLCHGKLKKSLGINYFKLILKIFFRKISEFFLLRDTTLIPNILWFEYTVTRKETRARQRKQISMKSQ